MDEMVFRDRGETCGENIQPITVKKICLLAVESDSDETHSLILEK